MNTRFFSPSTGGFYSEAIHGARQIAAPQTAREIKAGKRPQMIGNPECTIPADAVPVSEQRFAELMAAQADPESVRQIIAVAGKPMAADRVTDLEERIAARRRQRDRLLAESDWTQLSDASPVGGARAWGVYRQALRDLDMAGTDWPVVPGATSTGSAV